MNKITTEHVKTSPMRYDASNHQGNIIHNTRYNLQKHGNKGYKLHYVLQLMVRIPPSNWCRAKNELHTEHDDIMVSIIEQEKHNKESVQNTTANNNHSKTLYNLVNFCSA